MRKRHTRGFGLLEVTFSTAIFIVVVGSLVTLSRLSLRNAVLSTHRSQAMNLAQDGLETVRQMRDTAWIRDYAKLGLEAPDPSDRWLTWPHIRDAGDGITCSGDSGNGKLTYERPSIYSGTGGKRYGICYNDIKLNDEDPGGFTLFEVKGNSPSSDSRLIIKLVGSDGAIDPGQPIYIRTIRFESIPSTDGTSSQPSTGCAVKPDAAGLQLFASIDNKLCTLTNHETFENQPLYAMKVSSTVEWKAFDKDWQVVAESILTDWRAP